MQYSVVRYSEVLNSSYRFDSEYWVADVINYNKQFKTLSDLNIKVVSGPFGSSLKSEAYCNSGVPFVRISDLNNFFISKDNLIHISEEDHKRLSSSRLKYNDLVLSKVGNTIGVVSILTPEIGDECNISENNIGIRLWNNDLKINPYFLLSYLNCKIGQKQILRLISGNAQPKLNVADIKNLKLPIILDSFQLQIEELVKNSYKISNSSKSLYTEAENLLLEELGLKDWKPKHQLSYVKNYSDTQKAERFDAEYFQPQYEEVIEKIKNYQDGFDCAKNLISLNNKNYKPKDDKDYRYVELSNISQNGEVKGFTVAKGQDLPTRARRKINNQDLLLSSIEGSLDSISLIKSDYDNMLCSTGFFIVRSKNINPETMLIFFKSLIGQLQLKKGCSGTILTAISADELNKILIPKVKQEIQDEIKDKINKMYLFKSQSKSLLSITKQAVEIAIETSEEQASKWIDQELEKLGVQLI